MRGRASAEGFIIILVLEEGEGVVNQPTFGGACESSHGRRLMAEGSDVNNGS